MDKDIVITTITTFGSIVVALIYVSKKLGGKIDKATNVAQQARDYAEPTGNGFADGVTHMLAKMEFEIRMLRESMVVLKAQMERTDDKHNQAIVALQRRSNEIDMVIDTIVENVRKERGNGEA